MQHFVKGNLREYRLSDTDKWYKSTNKSRISKRLRVKCSSQMNGNDLGLQYDKLFEGAKWEKEIRKGDHNSFCEQKV